MAGIPTTMKQGFNYRQAGLGHVGSYQVSGRPFLTGSTNTADGTENKISFPYVAKSVTVKSLSGTDLRVSFTGKDTGETTLGKHYFTLTSDNETMTFNVKCKEIYITPNGGVGTYCLFAELTGIHPEEMYVLTGSGLTE